MKLLTDEQLCELELKHLKQIQCTITFEKVWLAQNNRWQRHQELGEYLHKIEQLITEKEHQ